ncbi:MULTISPECIES: ClpXP protease specificity-enhancing factor [Pseudoalteromonas]|uniref:Stringent starvation protein B n=3 Tax=Pseudoalteromonas TaxID=53246 RepID=Q3IG08_PSET1|nr:MULTISPECIES: ClpXP protease specificity-enhancing factor [Pseudoalteromonas]ALS34067.1 stringent starvation protein B [Pseudoalteromonas translucida KMM 520]ASM55144.1 stringent starvation protein B [Pseudoalteromonas nigrifaciens]MBB1369306.1 ClpXP protease specificity-enhancing factor [Pseudoalteromonas sp. SR45-4]MBB1405745.1 ClpXP protease specificity-enhancing factor [Pseudoalteromonas sp. SG44-5]MBE0419794.1 ClpXP protease specificity-enhancing factor [Pseudoalteromonas nigrifaciens]|tara:strand:- start:4887 stop:5324 length:438 start_codon:yes stop_codon:yes gene_type:complete
MTPNRPYLLRAFFDWIVDNECTPHLVVDADYPAVQVPTQFVQDGQIVLNISPSAVTQFSLDNEQLSFSARFGGQPMQVYVPLRAVLAIYARENGEGTVFTADEFLEDEDDFAPDFESVDSSANYVDETPPEKPEKKKGSHLRVIK